MTRDELADLLRSCKGKTVLDFGSLVDREATRRAQAGGPICGESHTPMDADLVGCGKPIESLADVYRCTDCAIPFHRVCAMRHFATDTVERSQEAFAEQLRRLEASETPEPSASGAFPSDAPTMAAEGTSASSEPNEQGDLS